MPDGETAWDGDASEAELPKATAEPTLPESELCASSSALKLPDEIWALLNPEAVPETARDTSELPSRLKPPGPIGCDEGCDGEVSDWMASNAIEAAPIAGNMALTPKETV